jgi:hypothetical protein
MVRRTGGLDSLNTTGRVLLTGVFSLRRPYLLLIIVALAIISLGIDSLNTTGRELLTGVFSLRLSSLYYRCAVEGSPRGRSGICKFRGFQPKRVFSNPRTQHHYNHTSINRIKRHLNSQLVPINYKVDQQPTKIRGCRKHPSPESIVGSGRDWIPAEMGKSGGWTTTKQRAESITAVSWEAQDLGIVETVFNVGSGIQMFNSPIQNHGVFDGIKMYSRVVKTSGPTVRTPKWIHEQGWIRGLVHRSITAYGELATLGVKHE